MTSISSLDSKRQLLSTTPTLIIRRATHNSRCANSTRNCKDVRAVRSSGTKRTLCPVGTISSTIGLIVVNVPIKEKESSLLAGLSKLKTSIPVFGNSWTRTEELHLKSQSFSQKQKISEIGESRPSNRAFRLRKLTLWRVRAWPI